MNVVNCDKFFTLHAAIGARTFLVSESPLAKSWMMKNKTGYCPLICELTSVPLAGVKTAEWDLVEIWGKGLSRSSGVTYGGV